MDSYDIAWTNKHACGVVIASEGYPESYESNKQVSLPVKSEQDMKLFHAGTKLIDDNVVTSGGRVFCATALGDDLKSAQSKAYNLVDSVTFDGAFHRRDIGFKGIK
jgi:phosphoribosylamine--glycine ligase